MQTPACGHGTEREWSVPALCSLSQLRVTSRGTASPCGGRGPCACLIWRRRDPHSTVVLDAPVAFSPPVSLSVCSVRVASLPRARLSHVVRFGHGAGLLGGLPGSARHPPPSPGQSQVRAIGSKTSRDSYFSLCLHPSHSEQKPQSSYLAPAGALVPHPACPGCR